MKIKLIHFSFLMLLFSFSCKKKITIKDIVDNPTHYEAQEVNVSGEVIKSFGIAGFGYFELSDGSAKILAVSQKGVPVEGKVVSIKGKVSQFLKIESAQVIGIECSEINQ